ncbi:MAG: HNH endonuclease, partial [Fimbriimonadaceae bacterium]
CHVSRYQGPQDNHPANGMILRSDLHTLFDLDLIGLNPADLSIAVHPDLMGTEYEKYSGTRLSLGGEKTIDMRAVRSRWELFCRR